MKFKKIIILCIEKLKCMIYAKVYQVILSCCLRILAVAHYGNIFNDFFSDIVIEKVRFSVVQR